MQSQTMRRSLVFFLILAAGLVMSFSVLTENADAAAKTQKITLKAQAKTVDVGSTVKVTVSKVKPAKASKKVTWKITKGKDNGALKAKKASSVKLEGKKTGSVTLKAKAKNGSGTKSITIKVKDLKAKSVTVSQDSLKMAPSDVAEITATVKAPQKYGYKKQASEWKTSDDSVATVDQNGNIKAVAPGKATITVANDGASADVAVTVQQLDASRPFTLVGSYDPQLINYVKVADNATVAVWNRETNNFDPGTKDETTIFGNFAKLQDNDGDGSADQIWVVKREDSQAKWDKNMVWMDDVKQGSDQPLDPAVANAVYGQKQRIPFGERQLEEYGVTDYSGTTDFLNVENSPYWTDNDYFDMKSGGTLTMLEGYKTQSQSTGWACVATSAVTVLEWYGLRGDLNEEDLGALRGTERARFFGGTSLKELENIYDNLTKIGIGTWEYIDNNNSDPEATFHNPAWIKEQLSLGHPIQVIWNSFGAHGQVIIGYDDLGTEETADDQVILMDPYDTTDHDNNGYVVQSYERLIYGVLTWDEPGEDVKYMAVWPTQAAPYSPSKTGGIAPNENNHLEEALKAETLNAKLFGSDGIHGITQADIMTYYKDFVDSGGMDIYPNGLSGAAVPADWAAEWINHDKSPYYNFADYGHYENGSVPGKNLVMAEHFKTVQQATEWTCGCASPLMVIEYFGKNGTDTQSLETEISISKKRQDGAPGGTYLEGVNQVFHKIMNAVHHQTWKTLDKNDLNDPEGEWSTIEGKSGTEYALQGGTADDGLIPYLLSNGVPIMIGSDEWGGHWQVIVGYDDLGTAGTQDDVLVIADPYDTTDHAQDGFVIKGFERLVYGWGCAFEAWEETPKYGAGEDHINNDFVVAVPQGYSDRTDAVIEELGMK